MGAWVVGKNITGYLPESDVWATEDWSSAMSALRDDLVRFGDDLAMQCGEESDEVAEIDAAIVEADKATPDADFLIYVSGGMPLDTAFWVTWEPEAEADND